MKITHQGKDPKDVPGLTPWYLHVENECEDCETRWMIEADDPKDHIALGALTVAFNNRSMKLAGQGRYHVSPPSDTSPSAMVWSWCPNCGRLTCTQEPTDELLTSTTPQGAHRA